MGNINQNDAIRQIKWGNLSKIMAKMTMKWNYFFSIRVYAVTLYLFRDTVANKHHVGRFKVPG